VPRGLVILHHIRQQDIVGLVDELGGEQIG
jgi:hypothetical protein